MSRMRILVTGANGMVARAVAQYAILNGDQVVALDRETLDITDCSALDLVFHWARLEAGSTVPHTQTLTRPNQSRTGATP
jgi:nucleoside-diphosphate-sugar epimerase